MFDRTRSAPARTSRRLFAVTAAAVIVLAACGDDDDDAETDATDAPAAVATTAAPGATQAPAAVATTEAPAAATTEAPATTANDRGGYAVEPGGSGTTIGAAAGGEGVVMVADSELGEILTDANGMSLYLFMPDAQGAPTCTSVCAETWPPLVVADDATVTGGDGVDASLVATATHPEEGTQVTYNGWPLYLYAGDSAPGDTTGQGSGGVWYLVDPTGNPISG